MTTPNSVVSNSSKESEAALRPSSIVLIGKPNCGKSLLFNRLTGLKQKVSNFPGVTVEVKSGWSRGVMIKDFPGIYSLNSITIDEEIAVKRFREALVDKSLSGVVCLLDATRLEHSLVLALQVQKAANEADKAILFAVNMMDEIANNGVTIDLAQIEREIGAPVVGISAKTGLGIEQLQTAIAAMGTAEKSGATKPKQPPATTDSMRQLARDLSVRHGPKTEVLLKGQNRLDSVFLNTWLGGLFFVAIMLFLFQSIFTWATPVMDLVEATVANLSSFIVGFLPEGMFADFVNDAIFGGIGSFLVFVPQIFILTFIIGVLEDSGYLARATIICHKPLSYFGLSGKSFVPLLSGHACAIPAIFAARTIESPRRRLITMIIVPLMSCSARLPVYALLIAALIPAQTFLGGAIGYQGLALFVLYAFGIVLALLAAGIMSKTILKKTTDAPFIIELPPYRLPGFKPLFSKSLESTWMFVRKAGPVIFFVTITVWVLGYFPDGSGHLDSSWLAYLGRLIEPAMAPLNLDWKYGVAILSSFVAREVFVGTLGTMFGIEGADENIAGLATQIQASGLTLASGVALLAFYVIALQCASTLAVIRKESGNYKLPVLMLVGYSLFAYIAALISYRLVVLF
jgi:ferrous iron transport protein B